MDRNGTALRSRSHPPELIALMAIGIADAGYLRLLLCKLCHQRPDRVLYLFGAPTAVCVRCLGIYAGAAVGSLLRLNHRLALRCLGAALALNLPVDVAAEVHRDLHGNHAICHGY